jgi:hypothetical protein
MPARSSPALTTGLAATRGALRDWRRQPFRTLAPWCAGSALIAGVLLVCVLLIGLLVSPDRDLALDYPPVSVGGVSAAVTIFGHNLLVLALHAMACVAGFIAGASLPQEAARLSGPARWIHEQGARLALAFVGAATLFSLTLQAISLGTAASSISAELHTSVPLLLLCLLPHALVELMALFLPLSAWLIMGRRGDWERLLAASGVTTLLALPPLAAAALWESLVAPHLVALLH